MLDILNYPTLRTLARILMTAPAGAAVKRVIDRFHDLESCVPDAGQMILQSIQYESYQLLLSDGHAMLLNDAADRSLAIALHGAAVLEEVREGTACCDPTGEECELTILDLALLEKWYVDISSEAEMEELVFATMDATMSVTHNLPLALELTQCLVTYYLAAEIERLEQEQPRRETGRTVRLAQYAIPWDHQHSPAYICNRGGEVFLLDGDLDRADCYAYLSAIRQAEEVVSHEELKQHLMDRVASPFYNMELQKAVDIWLGDERKRWGRPIGDTRE